VDCFTNTITCTQTVMVADNIPPVVHCPHARTIYACTNSVRIFYAGWAFDACAGYLPVSFSPPSGSFFPVGTTIVTCTATDPCGNVGTCTFPVTIINQILWGSRQLGLADCYKLPTDPAPKSAALLSLPVSCWKPFDATNEPCVFGASFMGLPRNIQCGQLWLRMKPNCTGPSSDDTINIGLNVPPIGFPTAGWSSYIGNGNGQTPSLLSTLWCGQSGCAQLFTFNLANMPNTGANLLPVLNSSHHTLDFSVQNSTTVDYAQLCFCYCRSRPWWYGFEWDVQNAELAVGADFASVSPLVSPGYATNFSVTLAPGSTHGIQFGLQSLNLGNTTNGALTVSAQTTLAPDADAIRITGNGAGSMSFALFSVRSNITQIQVTLRRGTTNLCQASVPATLGSNFLTIAGSALLTTVTATDDGNKYQFTLEAAHNFTSSACSATTADAFDVALFAGSAPPDMPDNELASLTLGAQGLDEIQLSNAAVQVSGLFPQVTGDAVASIGGDQLSITEADNTSTNAVGFSLSLPAVSAATLNIQPWFLNCWFPVANGQLNGAIFGQVSNQVVNVGQVSFTQTGQVWVVTGSFSGLGASRQRFQVFNQGALIADTTGQSNAVVSVAELPNAWALSSAPGAAPLGFTWPEPQTITINETAYGGDELRIMAVAPTSSVSAITGVSVEAVGVESVVLSSVVVNPSPAWVLQPPQIGPTQMTLQWTGPAGGVLESASTLFGPWITVPGQGNNSAILGSPLTNGMPVQFFRVRSN
jgi:hypothetical protein